ncbi:MAG: YvcK family protein [Desulfitobacterium hafniense]|nr:YvcK family protein [Desulfitobacterium hafniense]
MKTPKWLNPGVRLTKWLYPGMGVKRWLGLAFLGALVVGAGLAIINQSVILGLIEKAIRTLTLNLVGKTSPFMVGGLVTLAGLVAMIVGIRLTIVSIISNLIPEKEDKLVEIIYQKKHLKKGPKLVVIGGGTGLSVLLRGLKEYTSNITAVVTVADDGGSSGRLRGELGILPPGDIRNCLVALADKETLMEQLFQHRFAEGSGLAGHNLGNLLIAAMTEICGDFEQAIRETSRVLAIRGQVLPSTKENVQLCAYMEDDTLVKGETNISGVKETISRVFLEPADCRPPVAALEAIREADAIVLGPGSLYTSVLPNLLIKELNEAIKASSAVKIYSCNIMTQPGETDGYTASRHVRAILDHVGPGIMDYVLVNVEEIPKKLVKKYKAQGAVPVQADFKELEKLRVKVAREKLVFESDLVRHHPDKLSRAIISLIFKLKSDAEKVKLLDFYLGEKLKG